MTHTTHTLLRFTPSFCTAATCAVILKHLPNNLCSGLLCIDRHWHFPSASAAVLIIMIAVKITKKCRSNKHFGWKQCRTHVHLSAMSTCHFGIFEQFCHTQQKIHQSRLCRNYGLTVVMSRWPIQSQGCFWFTTLCVTSFTQEPTVNSCELKGNTHFSLVTGDCQAVADWSLGPCQWGLIPELCFSRKSML